MNIAVNTRLLLKNRLEGIGWFCLESLHRIAPRHPEHNFIFIFDRPFNESFICSDNVIPIVLYPPARHPFLYYTWFELSIPLALMKYKADLFFSPEGYLSLTSNVPQVNVIHDLNFEHYPQDLPWLESHYYRYFFPKYARKAKRIATVSEYSKKDIIDQYQISPDKIDVVYDGGYELFSPVTDEEKEKIKSIYTQCCDYFVFVGSLHPRKNISNLFRAYDIFRKSTEKEIKLVIVGEKKWWTSEIQEAYDNLEYKEDVVFTGRLAPKLLNQIIGSALAMTYVSYFEGFGIPIVEAFLCGTAVITSNVTSMPEVAGDAALYVDPFSPHSISEAMKKIAYDPELRMQLIAKGTERQYVFTWDKTADKLWDCIEKVISI